MKTPQLFTILAALLFIGWLSNNALLDAIIISLVTVVALVILIKKL